MKLGELRNPNVAAALLARIVVNVAKNDTRQPTEADWAGWDSPMQNPAVRVMFAAGRAMGDEEVSIGR